jgi:hypothetical protein
LWGLLAVVFGSAVVVAEYVIDGDPKWTTPLGEVRRLGWRGLDDWGYYLLKHTVHLLGKVAVGVAGAWLVHALLLRCGICISLRPAAAQAADYDDKPSGRPT